jgi:hypothetical protein
MSSFENEFENEFEGIEQNEELRKNFVNWFGYARDRVTKIQEVIRKLADDSQEVQEMMVDMERHGLYADLEVLVSSSIAFDIRIKAPKIEKSEPIVVSDEEFESFMNGQIKPL